MSDKYWAAKYFKENSGN